MALNPKHQAFVSAYLVDLNATQAAIAAGYSKKTAKQQGSRLLTNVDVAAAIKAGLEENQKKALVTREEVINELKLLAFSDPAKLVDENGYQLPLNKMPPEMRRCISAIELGGDGGTKIKFWPKNNALELLGKHLTLWTEKLELTGKDGEQLQVAININRGKK